MSSVIRHLDIDLRVRILQESFRKKPVFESYKNLCRDIGDDRLTYEEFEFWFYGFSKGEFFLDTDACFEPTRLTLFDLPKNVLENILMYIDHFDRLKLHDVSEKFEDVLDKLPLSTKNIKVTLRLGQIIVMYDNYYDGYWRTKNGCETMINGKKTIIEGGDYLEMFMEHFVAAVQHPQLVLKSLKIDAQQPLDAKPLDPIDYERFTRFLKTLKKPNDQPLKIRFLHFVRMKLDVSCHIMSLVKPGFLSTIAIRSSCKKNNYEAIYKKMLEMKQWKQATALLLDEDGDVSPGDLVHAQEFELTRKDMFSDEIIHLREMLLSHETFKYCAIKFPDSYDFTEIRTALGPCYTNKRWYVPVPRSLGFLEFTIVNERSLKITRII